MSVTLHGIGPGQTVTKRSVPNKKPGKLHLSSLPIAPYRAYLRMMAGSHFLTSRLGSKRQTKAESGPRLFLPNQGRVFSEII